MDNSQVVTEARTAMSRILSDADMAFFHENGYVVVRNCVPVADCDAVIDAAFAFLEMDRYNAQDWYREPLRPGGMIEMYQHQALWNTRQNPNIHAAMADLFGTEALWVSLDRVNVKPPPHPDFPQYDFPGFMHWDMDIATHAIQPFGVQGVLYLADTDTTMGGFQCAPGIHRRLDDWIARHGTDRVVRGAARDAVDVVPIPGNAGDYLIWDRRLLHGNGHNVSNRPRLAQFISMSPAPTRPAAFEEARKDRIYRWQNRLAPDADWAPGDPRGWEQKHGKTAELSTLGKRLLGLEAWG